MDFVARFLGRTLAYMPMMGVAMRRETTKDLARLKALLERAA